MMPAPIPSATLPFGLDTFSASNLFTQQVIFDGKQVFRKNRTSIELTLIEHTSASAAVHGVLEIVAYDPLLREEASRLYLRLDTLEAALQRHLLPKLQAELDRSGNPNTAILSQMLLVELKVEYVLTRLSLNSKNRNNVAKLRNLVDNLDNENAWSISLVAHFYDAKSSSGQLEVVCEKPAKLVPAVLKHAVRYIPRPLLHVLV